MNMKLTTLMLLLFTIMNMNATNIPWGKMPRINKKRMNEMESASDGGSESGSSGDNISDDMNDESMADEGTDDDEEEMDLPDDMEEEDVMDEEQFMKMMMSGQGKQGKFPMNGGKKIQMVSRKNIMSMASKRFNKRSFRKLIKRFSRKNKSRRKQFRRFRKRCPRKQNRFPSRCRKYDYCCYWNSSSYISNYLYRIYYYGAGRHQCRNSRLYTSRLAFRIMRHSPYWYKKYFWRRMVGLIYNFRC